MKKNLFFVAIIVVIILSCGKKDTTTPTTGTVNCSGVSAKYSTDASPVIASKCATSPGCHAVGATNTGGVLTNYTQISAKKSNIRASVINGSMPQGSTLTAAEKQAIVCWVDAGGLNN
jgi:hypothetical protein